MQIKRTVKIALAAVLAIACMASMFACEKNKGQINEDGKLPIQWENKVYYFQQGVRTDWKFINVSADKKMVDREAGLVCQLAPVADASLELTEEQKKEFGANPAADTRAAVTDVEYSVYYFGGEGVMMTDSTADVVKWIQDEASPFYFNTKHNTGSPREAFRQLTDPEIYYAKFSKLQFNKITYSFTKDGDDWKGELNLVMNGQKYFIVTYEAKADAYEKYFDSYEEIIGDFRKEGWETA